MAIINITSVSDYHPLVFAIFRANVREVDQEKRAVLHRRLLDAVTSNTTGEALDEKLANVTFFVKADECMWLSTIEFCVFL